MSMLNIHRNSPLTLRMTVPRCKVVRLISCYSLSCLDDAICSFLVFSWRYHFARNVLSYIVEKLCSAHPVKYSEILELDKRVSDFPIHPYLLRPKPKDKLGMNPECYQLHPLRAAWTIETGEYFPVAVAYTIYSRKYSEIVYSSQLFCSRNARLPR